MENKPIPASEKPDCIFFFDGTKKRAYKKKKEVVRWARTKTFYTGSSFKGGI